MALLPNSPAPYTSPPSIKLVLERARNQLPDKITQGYLIKSGIKESIVPRTMHSLRLLDLVDDGGAPTETLRVLSKARPDQYRAELANFVQVAYADIFKFIDPATSNMDEIKNAFWGYEPRGQIDSMIRLFLGLCEEAGLVDAETRARQVIGSPAKKPAPKPNAPRRAAPDRTGGAPPVRPEHQRVELSDGLPPGLAGLLGEIPRSGETWTTARRDGFLKAFEVVLNFSVPVDDTPSKFDDDEEDDL